MIFVATTSSSAVCACTAFSAGIHTRQRDRDTGAAVSQQPEQLVFGVDRIQRNDDRAKLPEGELRDDPLRAGGQDQGRPDRPARTLRAASPTAHASLSESRSFQVRRRPLKIMAVASGRSRAWRRRSSTKRPLAVFEGRRDVSVVVREPRALNAWSDQSTR